MKQVIRRHVAVLLVIFLVSTVWAQQAKYVFYFIGDGMGVNQVNGAEMYLAEQEGRIGVKPLLFTHISGGYDGNDLFRYQFGDRFFCGGYGTCHRRENL